MRSVCNEGKKATEGRKEMIVTQIFYCRVELGRLQEQYMTMLLVSGLD